MDGFYVIDPRCRVRISDIKVVELTPFVLSDKARAAIHSVFAADAADAALPGVRAKDDDEQEDGA